MRTNTYARAALPFIIGTIFAAPLYAQAHEHPVATASAATADAPSAETKQAFALIKSLSGRWQGDFVNPETKKSVKMETRIRVTSHGNSVVHEMKGADDPDESDKIDHPVTMMYLDGASLILTHYCDAGNRPRMVARVSPDGKVVDFDFLDVVGPTKYGHMQHARFTLIDDTHHLEDWTYESPNGKTVVGHFDLTRVSRVASVKPE
jgi:hypothetical protein